MNIIEMQNVWKRKQWDNLFFTRIRRITYASAVDDVGRIRALNCENEYTYFGDMRCFIVLVVVERSLFSFARLIQSPLPWHRSCILNPNRMLRWLRNLEVVLFQILSQSESNDVLATQSSTCTDVGNDLFFALLVFSSEAVINNAISSSPCGNTVLFNSLRSSSPLPNTAMDLQAQRSLIQELPFRWLPTKTLNGFVRLGNWLDLWLTTKNASLQKLVLCRLRMLVLRTLSMRIATNLSLFRARRYVRLRFEKAWKKWQLGCDIRQKVTPSSLKTIKVSNDLSAL